VKVICDVHISFKVVRFLISMNVESVHVNDILDGDKTEDQDICSYADKYEFTVLTKDSDFRNSHFIQGTPSRLLKINLGNLSTKQLIKILEKNLDLLIEKFEKTSCCIELFTDRINIHN